MVFISAVRQAKHFLATIAGERQKVELLAVSNGTVLARRQRVHRGYLLWSGWVGQVPCKQASKPASPVESKAKQESEVHKNKQDIKVVVMVGIVMNSAIVASEPAMYLGMYVCMYVDSRSRRAPPLLCQSKERKHSHKQPFRLELSRLQAYGTARPRHVCMSYKR